MCGVCGDVCVRLAFVCGVCVLFGECTVVVCVCVLVGCLCVCFACVFCVFVCCVFVCVV